MFKHNDFEIIDLIKQGNEDALALMVNKYERFIAKKIHKFNLAYHFDDLKQECIIILYKSVMMFDESFNKTFTRFFELNIERHMMGTIYKFKRDAETKYFHEAAIAESVHAVHEPSVYYQLHINEIEKILTPLEYKVYTLRELKNYAIQTITDFCDESEKRVYNALYRAKAKIHAHFKD